MFISHAHQDAEFAYRLVVNLAGLPNITWADIPAGTKQPYGDEYWLDGQPCAIPIKAFKLAAYPITAAQFRPFVVDARGWRSDEWWTEAGRKDRGKAQAPGDWNDPKWCIDDHPVVGVTWYAAVAYCRWRTAQLRAASARPRGLPIGNLTSQFLRLTAGVLGGGLPRGRGRRAKGCAYLNDIGMQHADAKTA